jgi:succinoglycan biosynthesis protein ExoM
MIINDRTTAVSAPVHHAAPALSIPAVSVVICTYNRPLLLEATVLSCLAQATCRGLAFEIIIADNSPEGHAEPLVARLADSPVAVRRVPASPPNISIARNAGLRAARAPLVAFLDDDLIVESGWLDALVDTMQRSDADVVLGRLHPHFVVGSPPVWDPRAVRFTRMLEAPSGTPIYASGVRRTHAFTLSTATSLWRVATCFTDPLPFDPAFGASGGEDVDMFLRLEARGCRFVWCAESVVRETIPAERSRLRYNVLRACTGSSAYAAATIKNAASRVPAAINLMGRGLLQAVFYGALAVLLLPFGEATWQDLLIRAAFGFGKFTWWRRIGLYQMERPPAMRGAVTPRAR